MSINNRFTNIPKLPNELQTIFYILVKKPPKNRMNNKLLLLFFFLKRQNPHT
jgi:hypothetical protein